LADSRHKAQMGAYWETGYLSAADLTLSLRCRSFTPNHASNRNLSEFCSREVERRIERALRLQATDPAKAGAAWAAVDRQIVDQAPTIGLLVPQGVDLVSKRVPTTSSTRCGDPSLASCGWSDDSWRHLKAAA
jgi:ABC-type transport system substrate-binding protein